MKFTRSTLRKILFERLILENLSYKQALEKLRKDMLKFEPSLKFVIKRDGLDKLMKDSSRKYNYVAMMQLDDAPEAEYPDAIFDMMDLELGSFSNVLSTDYVPRDIQEDEKTKVILWLIKRVKSDIEFAIFILDSIITDTVEPAYRRDMSSLVNQIRNNLELHSQFNHVIQPVEKRNIFNIKSIHELNDLMKNNKANIDKENELQGQRFNHENVIKGFVPLAGSLNIVEEDGKKLVVKNPKTQFYTLPDKRGFVAGEIHSKAASVKLGSDTDWCTAAPGLEWFEEYYNPRDPLFYIEDAGKRYQFHYGSSQFMDINDEPISRRSVKFYTAFLIRLLYKKYGREFYKKYPLVAMHDYSIASNEEVSKYIQNLPDEILNTILINKDSTQEIVNFLVNHKDEKWRSYIVSSYSGLDRDQINKFLSDESEDVRISLASTTSKMKLEDYEKLAEDPSEKVRANLASTENLDQEIYRKIANENYNNKFVFSHLLFNETLSDADNVYYIDIKENVYDHWRKYKHLDDWSDVPKPRYF